MSPRRPLFAAKSVFRQSARLPLTCERRAGRLYRRHPPRDIFHPVCLVSRFLSPVAAPLFALFVCFVCPLFHCHSFALETSPPPRGSLPFPRRLTLCLRRHASLTAASSFTFACVSRCVFRSPFLSCRGPLRCKPITAVPTQLFPQTTPVRRAPRAIYTRHCNGCDCGDLN